MRFSQYFLPTLKDVPTEAEIISHKLMLRAGMIKQSSAGIYSWLPLGFKVLKKIEQIVREEQNIAGAIEILMPTIQSADLWIKSGRFSEYGKEMLRIKDRSNRDMLYGPTNEELVTDIFQNYIHSYKDLPKNLYHIQWKFRDEVRPRFGVMRGREFLMKDNYSFDIDKVQARISYNNMFTAYIKTFLRMDLTPISLRADSGQIGGDLSHEFQILAKTGESTLYYDKDLETLDPKNINPKTLQSYYAAVDDLHDEENCSIPKSQLKVSKGIEVGHIFYFGTKYSEALGAYVQNNKGKNVAVHMGSYGIGISRLVGAIIEANHDESGIIWPKSVAPYHVSLINLMIDSKETSTICENLYQEFSNRNIEVLYDDRNISIGKKFSDNNLLGFPIQVIVGLKGLKDNIIEVKDRKLGEVKKLSPNETVNFVINQFSNLI